MLCRIVLIMLVAVASVLPFFCWQWSCAGPSVLRPVAFPARDAFCRFARVDDAFRVDSSLELSDGSRPSSAFPSDFAMLRSSRFFDRVGYECPPARAEYGVALDFSVESFARFCGVSFDAARECLCTDGSFVRTDPYSGVPVCSSVRPSLAGGADSPPSFPGDSELPAERLFLLGRRRLLQSGSACDPRLSACPVSLASGVVLETVGPPCSSSRLRCRWRSSRRRLSWRCPASRPSGGCFERC